MTRASHKYSHDGNRSDWSDHSGWYGHSRGDQDRDEDRGGHQRHRHHHRDGDSSYCNRDYVEPRVLSVGDSRAIEGNAEIFSVTLSGAVHDRLEVSLALAGGTATAGSDFRSSLEVSFDGGGTWRRVECRTVNVCADVDDFLVRVATIDDKLVESAEQFTLAAAANGGSDSGTGTIDDNDSALPALKIADAENTESMPLVFNLGFASTPITAGTIRLTVADGSALAGEDYQNALDVSRDGGATWSAIGSDGLLTVAAGEKALQLRVQSVDDFESEAPESFTLKATVDGGGTFTAAGTIYDNDFAFARAGNPANALLAADVLGGDTHPGVAPAAAPAESASNHQVAAVLLLPADDLLRQLSAQPPAFG